MSITMLEVIQWLSIIVAIVLGVVAIVLVQEDKSAYLTQEMQFVQGEVRDLIGQTKSIVTAEEEVRRLASEGRVMEVGHTIVPANNVNTGSGDRSDVVDVIFTKKYITPPKILLSPVQLDASSESNLRYVLVAEDITTTGFKLRVKTWSNTQLWDTSVQWATVI